MHSELDYRFREAEANTRTADDIGRMYQRACFAKTSTPESYECKLHLQASLALFRDFHS
jgi:hypothetical protein